MVPSKSRVDSSVNRLGELNGIACTGWEVRHEENRFDSSAVVWSLPAMAAQNVRPTTPPGGSQHSDYAYTAPKGWTSEAIPDGSTLLHSPVSNTGEKCFIGLLPLIRATGNLASHADAAWNYTFNEFEVRPACRKTSAGGEQLP
jgi:hypothetical protein